MTEGEVCHSWAYGVKDPDGAFPCPEHSAGMDVKFCCGTCSAPFCCSSEESRLDQAQCPPGQQAKRITNVLWPRSASTPNVPSWALTLVIILAIILLVPFGCGLIYAIRYAYRRFRRWWEFQNLDQHPDQRNFPLPTIHVPSVFDHPSSYCDDPPSYTAVVAPHGPWALSPTSNVSPAAQLGHANAGYQDDEAQHSPSRPSEPALATRSPSQSQARASSLVPSSSDAEESGGARAWLSASEGCPPPSYNMAHALDYDDPPPYSVEDPFDSRALAAAQAVAAPWGNPRVWFAAQGNPQIRLVDLCDARRRRSAVASPTVASDDPPPYSVAVSHGDPPPYIVAVSCGHQILPSASESPPVTQFQCATPGAAEAEVITLSPPVLLEAAAAAAVPILEPIKKEEELNCPTLDSSQ